MKTLIVYYTRSGNTRKVAEALVTRLQADVEVLQDRQERAGFPGLLSAGFDALCKRSATIVSLQKDPRQYDLVVIGTPIWLGTLSSAVRAYLLQQGAALPAVAFFCTCWGLYPERGMAEMAALSGKTPRAQLVLIAEDMRGYAYLEKLGAFVQELGQ